MEEGEGDGGTTVLNMVMYSLNGGIGDLFFKFSLKVLKDISITQHTRRYAEKFKITDKKIICFLAPWMEC